MSGTPFNLDDISDTLLAPVMFEYIKDIIIVKVVIEVSFLILYFAVCRCLDYAGASGPNRPAADEHSNSSSNNPEFFNFDAEVYEMNNSASELHFCNTKSKPSVNKGPCHVQQTCFMQQCKIYNQQADYLRRYTPHFTVNKSASPTCNTSVS